MNHFVSPTEDSFKDILDSWTETHLEHKKDYQLENVFNLIIL